ncbi:hypothetical protein MOVS_10715 (plasmid) [Moraxella ovis]|uniref:Uncharacterized protein n=1 Tax=Moraxella ovis TaxID=29433 RepID=A0A378QCG0_9GAMM|nr:hypothetical protein [Moraxella ovis]ANB92560.1 hypothetical protein MOVS_10715 [Moraxella ovis]STY98597.1 Uncharacterised protein [Moraxella ovis]
MFDLTNDYSDDVSICFEILEKNNLLNEHQLNCEIFENISHFDLGHITQAGISIIFERMENFIKETYHKNCNYEVNFLASYFNIDGMRIHDI